MKVIAYLGFTLLSILIQFVVMDLTKEKINLGSHQVKHNTTNQKEKFQELLKNISQKPHALYYRTQGNKESNVLSSTISYRNVTTPETDTTTISSTIIDELYDENSSTTEDAFTTESLYTSSEFDNVTEISFFDKKNQSTLKSGFPKKAENRNCICNFLYQVCDINCCCDPYCSDSERIVFGPCKDIYKMKDNTLDRCYPYQYFSKGQDNIIDNLFCIAQINLPEKRHQIPKKYDAAAISHSFKWHIRSPVKHTEFERKPYVYGEPVWVLKEGSIWYIDIPSPTFTHYCSGRKPILFLNNVNVKCIVHMKDLEMFQILKTSKEAPCISVTEKSINTTALNCSTLHCTNWTIVVCDDKCVNYNKSIHEPFCTDKYCTNVAFKMEYIFYYYNLKIMNATIKLYTYNVSSYLMYVVQEISVKFILANRTVEEVTELSGNPGYVYGRPVISSFAASNRSLNFFNTTSVDSNYMLLPSNKNGYCAFLHNDPELVLFGLNKRKKCRIVYKSVRTENKANVCNDIEKIAEQTLGLTKKTFVCPFGNPLDIKDISWIPIQHNLDEKEITYGQFIHKKSKLRCYNLVTRISYIFTFADVSEVNTKKEYKIESANISVTTKNFTFNPEDISAVLTIDIHFIDGTKPRSYEYASGPYLNFYLPKDFFFPFRSNGYSVNGFRSVIIFMCFLVYQVNEINFW